MALSRNYYCWQNYVMPDCTSNALSILRSMLWTTKAFLTHQIAATTGTNGTPPGSAAWTVIQSSDGSTVSSSDLWTGTYDDTKLVKAGAGAPHAWMVLRTPSNITALGVPFYATISLAGSNDQRYTIRGSKTLPTGGTISADPTAPDEWVYSSQCPVQDQNLGTRRASYVTDNNGNAFITFSRTGTGIAHSIIAPIMAFLNPQAADLFPVCTIVDDFASQRGALAYNANCMTGAGLDNSTGIHMRSPGGGRQATGGGGSGIMYPISASWGSNTNTNEGTGKHDTLAAQVNFYSSQSGGGGAVRGVIPDWWICNSAMPVGNVEPATGTTEHMLIGNCYVPNDGVVPTL